MLEVLKSDYIPPVAAIWITIGVAHFDSWLTVVPFFLYVMYMGRAESS